MHIPHWGGLVPVEINASEITQKIVFEATRCQVIERRLNANFLKINK